MPEPSSSSRINPFPGLRPFQMDEKYLFFGREEQTRELVQRLRDNRFLAVVGTSGSGKSSLVQAGLLPQLYGGTMLEAGFQWAVAVMRPGGDPMTHLAQALVATDLYDPDRDASVLETRATLSRSGLGLVEAVRQSDIEEGSNLLVVVDQFEEIFRFRRTGTTHMEEAAAFVKLLLRASQQSEIPIYVALTMRSDYLGDCSEFSGLAEAVNHGEYLIPRLSRKQRRSAIAGPVRVGGGEISPRLLQMLLNDVGDNPDHLPVLQHALMRTWDYWESHHSKGEPIDLRHYEGVGGMDEALSRHADEVYDELPDDHHRAAAEKIFKALTERSTDNRGIRRPGHLGKLCAVAGTGEATAVTIIEAFRKPGRTFLMPGEDVELQPETVVDISHESLMRVWRRLDGWVEEESQSAGIYRRLRETAELHSGGRAGLYHDPDLQIAQSWREQSGPNEAWAEQYGGRFEPTVAFLEQSEEAARKAKREREAARERELKQANALAETQQRAARGFRRFAMGMAVVALAAVVAFGFALKQKSKAQDLKEIADSETEKAQALKGIAENEKAKAEFQKYAANLLAAKTILDSKGGGQGIRILNECPEEFRNWEWDYLRLQADQSVGGLRGLTPVVWAGANPDGSLLVTIEAGGLYKLWDARAVFDPQRESEGLGRAEGANKLWDAGAGEIQPLFELDLGGSYLSEPKFSPDGKRLAILYRKRKDSDSTEVALWDLSTGKHQLVTCPAPEAIHFANSQQVIGVVQTSEGKTEIRDLTSEGGALCTLELNPPEIRDAVFSPDGRWLATTHSGLNDRREVWVWDTATGKRHARQEEVGLWISQISFGAPPAGADGQILVACPDGYAKLWDFLEPGGGQPTQFDSIDNRMNSAVFGPGGLMAMADGYGIQVWRDGKRTATLFGHETSVRSVCFTQLGDYLFSAGDDGTVRFWETEPRLNRITLDGHRSSGNGVSFNSDGTRLAASRYDKTLRIYDATTGQGLQTFDTDGAVSGSVQFHPEDPNLLVAGGWGTRKVMLWDLETGKFRELSGPQSVALKVEFTRDGKRIVAVDREEEAFVWDTETGVLLKRFPISDVSIPGYTAGLAIAPDGKSIATCVGERNSLVQIWSLDTGLQIGELDGGEPRTNFSVLAFHPHGLSLAGASGANEIVLWDLASGEVKHLKGHLESVRSLAFSPDGKRLFSGSADDTFRVWDAASGRDLLHVDPPTWDINSIAMSRDGTRLALLSGVGGSVVLYDTRSPSESLSRARRTVDLAQQALRSGGRRQLPAAEVIEALGDDQTLSPEVREMAIKLAQFRGDDTSGAGRREQLDKEIAEAKASGEGNRAKLAELHLERFQSAFDLAQGLTEAAREDWEFLRAVPAAELPGLTAEELSGRYFTRFRAGASRPLEQGEEEAAIAAGRMEAVRESVVSTGQRFVNSPELSAILERLAATRRKGEPTPVAAVKRGGETSWKYLDTGVDPGAEWKQPGYDDAAWSSGPADLGFGGDGEGAGKTISRYNSENEPIMAFYFRHEFDLTEEEYRDLIENPNLTLKLRRDDGAVVYLNGVEVVRDKMPGGEIEPDTLALRPPVSLDDGGERRFFEHRVPSSLLRAGRNLLAVEVHQVNTGSSDIVFDLELAPAGQDGPSYFGMLSDEEIEVLVDEAAEVMHVDYGPIWRERARFLFAPDPAGLAPSPLMAEANAWLQRSRVQFLRLKFDRALQAIDRGLELLDESAPERAEAAAFREKVLRFTDELRP